MLGVHNEIHKVKKPSKALPSQVFQVVAKVIKGQRAHFRQRWHIWSPKGTVPLPEAEYDTLKS